MPLPDSMTSGSASHPCIWTKSRKRCRASSSTRCLLSSRLAGALPISDTLPLAGVGNRAWSTTPLDRLFGDKSGQRKVETAIDIDRRRLPSANGGDEVVDDEVIASAVTSFERLRRRIPPRIRQKSLEL